ncbi:MAG: transposase [Nitrospinae bacterium]|nr:transposase [Nitrospinota bacterium]
MTLFLQSWYIIPMARPWRIEFEGAFYHVMSRGNERRPIFLDAGDRSSFLKILGEMSKRFEVEVLAYVLMDNHYHLLLRTRRANLSQCMQWAGTTYTRRYNIKHGRSGHLFQGRFKNMLVENEKYITRLSCYIHRNPLRAGLAKRLTDYQWSSYPVYAYGKKPPEWLETKAVLLNVAGKDKHKSYREMVQNYSGEEKRTWEDFKHGLFLGAQKFIDRVKSRYSSEKPDKDVPQKRRVLRHPNPEAVVKKAASALKWDMKFIMDAGRRATGGDKDKRDLLIFLLWDTGFYGNKEIGDIFGLSYSSVSKSAAMIKERISKDRKMKQNYQKIS